MLPSLATVVAGQSNGTDSASALALDGSRSTSRSAGESEAFAAHLRSGVTRVGAQRTPISASVARDAIARAYFEATGQRLSDVGQSILTAQWAHETAHGASMFNYNFGGIKGVGPSGMTVAQRTREGYGSNERRITDQFRAYASADEGAKDYVQLLRGRYGEAVSAAQRGDASGFVRALKHRGYFTGDPAAYERNIVSLARQFGGAELVPESKERAPVLSNVAAERVAHVLEKMPAASTSAGRQSPEASAPLREQSSSYEARAIDWQMRAITSLLLAPAPSALLEGSERATSEGTDEPSDLARGAYVDALSMADEVTRAALQLARDDADRRRGNGLGPSSQG